MHAFADGGVDDVITDFADREIIGVRGYGDRQTEHWLRKDNPAAQTYQALQRAFPHQRILVTSSSDDGRLAIVFVDSDINPGDYYLFDTVTKRADFLRAGRIWIEPKQMRPKEPFALKARDGLELHGYVTRPAGDGPHPMVVLPHGGPHGVRDTWEYDPEVQLLASRGYAVLQVNYPRQRRLRHGFPARRLPRVGRARCRTTSPTRRAGRSSRRSPTADRICIYGGSYGGYAALMSAAREPDLYRCAIGYAGVYDLPLMFESGDTPDRAAAAPTWSACSATTSPAARAQSPVYNAQNIKVPVLLIHGKADRRADYEHAKRMRAALEQNQKKSSGWRSAAKVTASTTRTRAAKCTSASCSSSTPTCSTPRRHHNREGAVGRWNSMTPSSTGRSAAS